VFTRASGDVEIHLDIHIPGTGVAGRLLAYSRSGTQTALRTKPGREPRGARPGSGRARLHHGLRASGRLLNHNRALPQVLRLRSFLPAYP
jgi:hypothetical protein